MEKQIEVIEKILEEMSPTAAKKIKDQMKNVKSKEENPDLNSEEEKLKEELRNQFDKFMDGLKQEKEQKAIKQQEEEEKN